MKNLFLLIALCTTISICSSHAQYLERSFQDDFYSTVTELRQAENGDFLFTVLNDGHLSLPKTLLYRVDNQGDTIHFPIFNEGEVINADWIALGDSYVTTAYFFQCDIIVRRHLARYDAAGTLLWRKVLYLGNSPTDVPMKLLPGPDSTFWIFRAGHPPVQFNAAGDSIDVADLAAPLFTGYTTLDDGRFLTYGPAGLAIYKSNLNSVQSGFSGQPVRKAAILPDGRFAVLTMDKLMLADSSFNVIQSVNYSVSPSSAAVEMAAGDSGIWLLAATIPKKLLHYDTELNLLETKIIPVTAPFQPAFLSAKPTGLILWGNEYSTFSTQVVHLRSMPVSAVNFEATPDAALLEITMPHLPVDYYEPMYNYHATLVDSVSVTLSNAGTDTLERITINAVLGSSSFVCEVENQFEKWFSDLHLAPGASTSLYIGSFTQTNIPHVYWPDITLCFWTTLPNDSLDHNAANNMICNTFEVLVPVKDVSSLEPLRAFPNPASTACRLEWPNQRDQTALLHIVNMAGQVVIETTVAGNNWNFLRHDLPAGLYNVKIVTAAGRQFLGKVLFD